MGESLHKRKVGRRGGDAYRIQRFIVVERGQIRGQITGGAKGRGGEGRHLSRAHPVKDEFGFTKSSADAPVGVERKAQDAELDRRCFVGVASDKPRFRPRRVERQTGEVEECGISARGGRKVETLKERAINERTHFQVRGRIAVQSRVGIRRRFVAEEVEQSVSNTRENPSCRLGVF